MKAVLMAGGEGSRLRPLTLGRPKPMVPMVNKPVIAHIFDLLKRHQVTDVVVTVQNVAERIHRDFGDGQSLDMRIHYLVEDKPLGTAGSVKNARALLHETFLVVCGDALSVSRDMRSPARPCHPGEHSLTRSSDAITWSVRPPFVRQLSCGGQGS